MAIVLFEDDQTADLYPVALGRAAFDLSCGGATLRELAGRFGQPLRAVVRPHLRPLLAAASPSLFDPLPVNAPAVYLNARLAPSAVHLEQLRPLIEEGRPFLAKRGEVVLAGSTGGPESFEQLRAVPLPVIDFDGPIISLPHDLVRLHPGLLIANLGDLLQRGCYRQVAPGVFAAAEVAIHPSAVFDASGGPIVIDRAARVGPLTIIHGPCRLGPNTVVNDHTSLRPNVSAAEGCRLGGEVSNCIFEPFANKQHYGFLGDSYVGCWVNLGAGTTGSNLKNTYGTVVIRYGEKTAITDMQFLGAIIGDYAKTAVGTVIYTGKVIGAGSMIFAPVRKNVPCFVNHVPPPGRPTAVDVKVAAVAHRRMFARRNCVWTDLHTMLLRAMYDLTAAEREGLPVAPPDLG